MNNKYTILENSFYYLHKFSDKLLPKDNVKEAAKTVDFVCIVDDVIYIKWLEVIESQEKMNIVK